MGGMLSSTPTLALTEILSTLHLGLLTYLSAKLEDFLLFPFPEPDADHVLQIRTQTGF